MNRFDVAIVGAGIAGASIAASLAAHRSILLIEAEERPGYHSTGRSAAFWTESYGGPGVQPLTSASFAALSDGGFLSPRGALHLEPPESPGAAATFLAEFAGSGVRMDAVDRSLLERLVPGLRAQWLRGIWEPNCHDIDVAALHGSYLRSAQSGGAQLICRAGLHRARYSDGYWSIDTQKGNYEAALIVNAAGAWADDIAARCGTMVRDIRPYRRTIAQLRMAQPVPASLPLTLGLDGSFYFKPEAGGRLWLSPHDETPAAPADAVPEEIDVAAAIDRLHAVTRWRVEAVEHRWAGLRSFAPDRLPVIGYAPDHDAFFWFAGQGGFGIQTAPVAAALAAHAIIGAAAGPVPAAVDGALYSPARFA